MPRHRLIPPRSDRPCPYPGCAFFAQAGYRHCAKHQNAVFREMNAGYLTREIPETRPRHPSAREDRADTRGLDT